MGTIISRRSNPSSKGVSNPPAPPPATTGTLNTEGAIETQVHPPPRYQLLGPGTHAHPVGSCAVCEKPTKSTCSKCRSVFYCGRKHRKENWLAHKPECVPSKIVKAILLPVDEDDPRLVNVVCKLMPRYDSPQLDLYLHHPTSLDCKSTDPHTLLPGRFNYIVSVWFRDAFAIDGSRVNQCVRKLTRGLAPHEWAGPIVILKERYPGVGMGQYSERYDDADSSMLEPIVRYFLSYGRQWGH